MLLLLHGSSDGPEPKSFEEAIVETIKSTYLLAAEKLSTVQEAKNLMNCTNSEPNFVIRLITLIKVKVA